MTQFFHRTAAQASLAKAAGTSILTLAAAACALVREWRHNYRSRRNLLRWPDTKRYDLNFFVKWMQKSRSLFGNNDAASEIIQVAAVNAPCFSRVDICRQCLAGKRAYNEVRTWPSKKSSDFSNGISAGSFVGKSCSRFLSIYRA